MSAPVLFEAEVAPSLGKPHGSRRFGHWPMQFILAAATLLLHTLLLMPVLLGSSVHGEGGTGNRSQSLAGMTLITLSGISVDTATVSAKLPPTTAPNRAVAEVVSIDPLQQISAAAGDTDHSRPEPPPEALLFARYMGQVTSRLQAAWHPAPALVNGVYHCRIHLTQDADGVIEGVELLQCGQDLGLLQTLQNALDKAAPLPAHPGQGTGNFELMLEFVAEINAAGILQTRVIPAGAAS